MKRIKLVVSDLHLGKGRILQGGALNSLEEFYFAERFVEFINYYMSGEYKDYQIELILNGDIFNFLQVDYRGHFLTVLTEGVTLSVLRSIIEGHPQFFNAIKEFAAKEGNQVTYVVGNHDQGMFWPACRNYLDEVIGKKVKYRNIVYYFDGVHIEHGHMYEAANRLDTKRFFLKKDLPEPILNLPLGSHFFVEFVLRVKNSYPYVDKIRPFSKMLRWALLSETSFFMRGVTQLITYFLRILFFRDPRRQVTLRKVLHVLLESAVFPDLSEQAKKILNDERVHTVIFGHTHVYQYRQWADDMEYFNTGTWTELTSLDMPSLGKITKLTYVLIEYPDDGSRPRGRLKEWRGYHRIEEDVVIA